MFNAYCTDTATRMRFTRDKWNTVTDTVETEVKGRMTAKIRLIRDSNGEQVVSSGYFEIADEYDITNKDNLKYDSVKYSIIKVSKVKSFTEIEKTVVYLS